VRTVFAIDVRCPVCQASPGARCRGLVDASHMTAPHEARRQRAREERERLNPDHVAGQLPLWGKR
jgi:hypothetical protein